MNKIFFTCIICLLMGRLSHVVAQSYIFELVADIQPGPEQGFISHYFPFSYIYNDRLYFPALNSYSSGEELWASDGTSNGTVLVKDINPNGGSNPYNFTEFNGKLYFTAWQDNVGYELWVTDGTNVGTHLVKNLNHQNGGQPEYLEVLNNQLFFTALDSNNLVERRLWRSDGTELGTYQMHDIYVFGGFGLFDGRLFFNGIDHRGGELWATNGTAVGTVLIKEFIDPGSGDPHHFVPFNGKLYFSAFDGVGGLNQLWVTDGTTGGTQNIKKVTQAGDGLIGFYPIDILGNKLFYATNDVSHGWELWVTDGSTNGTVLFKDINPGPNGGLDSYGNIYTDYHQIFNNELYFLANDGQHGFELWKTDGTSLGTQMVKDINVGNLSSFPKSFCVYDNHLFFVANDGINGYNMWVSDGTETGTYQITPGPLGNGDMFWTEEIVLYNDAIYFQASYGSIGREFWRVRISDVGINEIKTGLNLYPNPIFGENLNVIFDQNAEFVIRNFIGQEVQKGILHPGHNQLNVRTLSSGVYYIQSGIFLARFQVY